MALSLAALDALQPYAGLGEVWRDFGGAPAHLRIAGYMGAADRAATSVVERLRAREADEPFVLDLKELRGPRESLEAVLGWARGCPAARVVMPRRWDDEDGCEIPASRAFESVEDAGLACRSC